MRKAATSFFALAIALCAACDQNTLTGTADNHSRANPRRSVVTFSTVQFSVPDTIVADSATQRCDIPLTYASSNAANGQFDSSSVRVWETEMPLNAATMYAFMGPIVAGMEHTGVLLDSSLPVHVATAPYTGRYTIYHSFNGVPQGGATLTWLCVRYHTPRPPHEGLPLEPPA